MDLDQRSHRPRSGIYVNRDQGSINPDQGVVEIDYESVVLDHEFVD